MTRSEANRLIGEVRSALGSDAVADSCSRDGCDVSTKGLPKPLLIADADAQSMNSRFSGKRPDFILYYPSQRRGRRQLVAILLELKSGMIDPVGVAEQLQGGATFLEMLGMAIGRCHPVVIHGRRIPSRQRRLLSRQKIKFEGSRLTILTSKCGERRNLAKAVVRNE